jgi:UDP-N-acetylmuramoyl-tripeptide--D-alanyl-D-alanine ligase
MVEDHGACGAAWFANAAGGELTNGNDCAIERVETDSRNAGPGSLFVALAGERTDGHDYARKAADSGSRAVLVSASWWSGAGRSAFAGSTAAVIVVPDTLAALQRAATAWRSRFPSILRFGVTGSAGKTSTKELLAAIVGASRPTVRNPGNLNSDIGLPASIFLMRPTYEAAVFAMVYEPDCALVTNIGTAHIGVLGGTREAIAAEKKRIASRFDGRQTLVAWEDDDYRDALLAGILGRCETYGPRSTDGFEGARDLGLDGWVLRYRGLEARLRLPGPHNLLNALGAIRAAALFGSGPAHVVAGLESVEPLVGRTSIRRGEYTVVDDCYNANAESMAAAIEFCDSVEVAGRRVYVLGSMLELGDESAASHARMGEAAAASRADVLVFYGDEAKVAYDAALASGSKSNVRFFDAYDSLEAEVAATVRPGDLVLVKASHSLALERLAERLAGTGGYHVP